MKKIAIVLLGIFVYCSIVAAQEPTIESQPTLEQQAFEDEDGSVFSDSDFGEEIQGTNDHTNKMVFLDAVQKHFWNPNRKLQDNNINILHRDGDTHKIRTRYAMITTFIFDNDRIAEIILGDPNGFEARQIPNPNGI